MSIQVGDKVKWTGSVHILGVPVWEGLVTDGPFRLTLTPELHWVVWFPEKQTALLLKEGELTQAGWERCPGEHRPVGDIASDMWERRSG